MAKKPFTISKKIEGENELGKFIEYHIKEKPRTKVVIQQEPTKKEWVVYTITPKHVNAWSTPWFWPHQKDIAMKWVVTQLREWGPAPY